MQNQQAEGRLTRRQRDVLAVLRRLQAEGRPPPTLDAVCGELGLRSRGSLHKHVQALVDAGWIEAPGGLRRGLRLNEPEDAEALPLLGVIAAGAPIEAIEAPEPVGVPTWLRGNGPSYVLKVRGDSMIEDGILDGDWVVVEQRDTARNGEIVVALIDGWEATLKRIEQHADRVVLHPANACLEPLVLEPERVQVRGVVVGQMRRYG